MCRFHVRLFLGLALCWLGDPVVFAAKRPAPALAEKFTPAQVREDFRVLRSALEKLHPGLHLHTPKAELKQLFDDTAASFKEPVTRLEFYLRVAPVVEKVKCGHTYFDLPRRTLKKLSTDAQSFPLPLIFLDRKALVDLPGGVVPLGAEITAIDGHLMPKIIKKMLPYIRSDGFNETMKYRMLGDEFELHHRLVFGEKKEFSVEYIAHGAREKKNIKLSSVDGRELGKIMARCHSIKGKMKNFAFRKINDTTALLSVNSFDFGMKKKGRQRYREFLKKTFLGLKAEPEIKHLIVDVRQNEGGFVGYDTRLFAYLAQKPFRDAKSATTLTLDIPLEQYLDKREFFRGVERSVEKSLVKEFERDPGGGYCMSDELNRLNQPKGMAFRGKLWFLISGWTHSGGATLGSFAANNDNVTFIGEETGGNRFAYTAGNMVLYSLPHTQCQLEVPMILYRNDTPEGDFPRSRGIQPKHQVIQTQADFIKGRDTVLEFTRDLINRTKP
jgi:hypothetical protein